MNKDRFNKRPFLSLRGLGIVINIMPNSSAQIFVGRSYRRPAKQKFCHSADKGFADKVWFVWFCCCLFSRWQRCIYVDQMSTWPFTFTTFTTQTKLEKHKALLEKTSDDYTSLFSTNIITITISLHNNNNNSFYLN